MNDVKSQTINRDLQSLKPWNTLWALWILFFHSKKSQLCYMHIEVLSNQASKKPRTINNALKMHRTFFFIRFMTSRMNYSLLFMLIKINVQKKKETSFFSYQTSSFCSSPSLWNKRSSHDVFLSKTSLPNTRANNLFSKKDNNQGVARFQKQIVLDSHRNNFCFQNARSRFQDSF